MYTVQIHCAIPSGIELTERENQHLANRNLTDGSIEIRKFENREKLYEGKSYWSYYRRIQTTQERRYAADHEHRPFVRGRRSYANLPNSWDDYYFRREKNWKARDKKARRQWGVNVSKHADTIKMPPPWDCILEDPDDYN